jgi:serine/threonine protein kinase
MPPHTCTAALPTGLPQVDKISPIPNTIILLEDHFFHFHQGVTLHEFLTGRRPFDVQRLIAFRDPLHCDPLEPAYLISRPYLSLAARDFAARCLERHPQIRLGTSGLQDLRAHIWLRELDWDALVAQTLVAPFIPAIDMENEVLKTDEMRNAIFAHLDAPRPQVSAVEQSRFNKFRYNVALKVGLEEASTRSASTEGEAETCL